LQELRVVQQFLAPNTRAEVNLVLHLSLPLSPALAELVRRVLLENKSKLEVSHDQFVQSPS
ncbi:MAG: hypothetical protein ACRDHG_02220, partial [Anaerolineales bacterium]